MIDVPEEVKEEKNDWDNKKRRSIRKYKSKVVVKEAIAQILQAEMLALSSKNCQLWKFVVATESAKAEAVKQWKRESYSWEKKEPFIPDSRPYINGGRAYASDHAAGSYADFYCEHTGSTIQ